MRRILLTILLLLCPSLAQASDYWTYRAHEQQLAMMQSITNAVTHGAAVYTGPCDIVTFTAWWGDRACSSAKRGTKAVRLCNVADVACADINSDATTGIVPNAPTVGLITCGTGANQCTVRTRYDQAGTDDLVQTTEANRPLWKVSAIGSLGCTEISSITTTRSIVGGTGITLSLPWSAETVHEVVTTGGRSDLINNGAASIQTNTTGLNQFRLEGIIGIFDSTAADGSFHAAQSIFNTTNTSQANIDGSSNSGSAGGAWAAAAPGQYSYAANNQVVITCEVGVAAGAFSGGNITSLNSNAHTFWGF